MKFSRTALEEELIEKIAERAKKKYSKLDRATLEMDLIACHSNGTPIQFDQLFAFDDVDFFHDIFGITKNINRKTGKLENYFFPRAAVR